MRWFSSWSALVLVAACGRSAERPAEPPPRPPPPARPGPHGECVRAGGAKPAPQAERSGPLRIEGAPEVPAALAQRISRYLETRSADFQWIDADGTTVLVTTRFAQTAQVHRVDQPMGARTQLTFEPEPVRDASFAPGRSDALFFMKDRGGDEQYQILRQDLDTGAVQTLTDGKSRHGRYLWNDAGSQFAFSGNARNGKDMDVYVADAARPEQAKRVLTGEGYFYPVDFSGDGGRLLVSEYVSINDSRLHVVDLASAKVQQITPAEPAASYRAAVFDPAGTGVYVASDREGEFVELYHLDPRAATWTPLTRHIPWNVEELALSGDVHTLAFTVNEEGYTKLYLLDTRSGKAKAAPGMPRAILSGLRFAQKTSLLAFTVMGPTTTGDAFSYDVRSARLRRWTKSEMGGLDPARFVEPELLHYESFDGRKIPAFYYRPKGEGPHPVVISIHGGPEAQARPYFSALIQYLVTESNIAVLVPNVRGSDGYGKSYLLLDNAEKREDSVKDIGALLDFVEKRPELDQRRVGVYGGSYGGYMVLAALATYPKRIAAGVDVVGISNFVTFLENTKEYRRDLRRAEYGDERDPKMREFLQRISPTSNAENIQSALFVAHGKNDPRVPVAETDQIVQAVRRRGKDVWYMVAANEGHGFAKKDNRDKFIQLTVLFFQRHLGQP